MNKRLLQSQKRPNLHEIGSDVLITKSNKLPFFRWRLVIKLNPPVDCSVPV